MASNALICANDNIFNKSILGEDAFYFNNADQVASCINNGEISDNKRAQFVNNNIIELPLNNFLK